ncbi:type VI secretion system Vgr family protein [Inquilinus sp. YAF38]|uniref:type VI secretion system Vgr family protein n=1 Tax=Inquilinus sp. YAF38 TaxID=3233084 RepID=UPI003F8E8167
MPLSTIESLLKDNRFAAVTSAAFQLNEVYLRRLRGVERLGEPFVYEVTLASPDPIQTFAKVPGQSLTVGLKLKGTATRFFHGIVTRFQYLGLDDTERLNYVAEVRPWLSLLDYRRNSRIFQNKTSLEIITQIFQEHKGTFKGRPTGRLPRRPFCVQYDETDLAFVSRLMEQDGIYYYFEHAENRHDLVLVDNASSHKPCTPQVVETHHNLRPARNLHQEDLILRWEEMVSMQPDRVVFNDYDHEKPTANLEAVARVPSVKVGGIPPRKTLAGGAASRRPGGSPVAPVTATKTSTAAGTSPTQETFVYPGRYIEKKDGDFYATIRAEELACNAYRARVESTARQITTGAIFTAANPFYYGDVDSRPKPTERFLAVGNEFTVVGEVGEVGGAGENAVDAKGDRFLYRSMVEIIPATTQYRSLRRTPAPVIQGPQTAVVVGPKAETITTDKLGRIKVQFFWDREGKSDENSSCWIRVAQSWAGKGFGGLIIPRKGQEVVVDFIHGNPDWPLVTGVVYNATNLPPETLPADKTRSTFRTHTDRGAVNAYNELRFEDKQDREEVYLQAQRQYNVKVLQKHAVDVTEKFVLTTGAATEEKTSPMPSLPGEESSRIEVTPDRIRFLVNSQKGWQLMELGPDGLIILANGFSMITTDKAESFPPILPGRPPKEAAKAKLELSMETRQGLEPGIGEDSPSSKVLGAV